MEPASGRIPEGTKTPCRSDHPGGGPERASSSSGHPSSRRRPHPAIRIVFPCTRASATFLRASWRSRQRVLREMPRARAASSCSSPWRSTSRNASTSSGRTMTTSSGLPQSGPKQRNAPGSPIIRRTRGRPRPRRPHPPPGSLSFMVSSLEKSSVPHADSAFAPARGSSPTACPTAAETAAASPRDAAATGATKHRRGRLAFRRRRGNAPAPAAARHGAATGGSGSVKSWHGVSPPFLHI